MARKIQSQSGRSQPVIGAFLGMLANAVFWLVAAIVVPVRAIVDAFPALAPHASWVPILFYALAFWSFMRAARILQRLSAGRTAPLLRAKAPAAAQPQRPAQTRKAKTDMGLPVSRTPTVQRLR